jgi:predicted TIM-barrel fold metal-dependent hydrolase
VQVAAADPAPWIEQARQRPQLRLVLLQGSRSLPVEALDQIALLPNVWLDMANWEGVGGLTHLLERVTADRIVFGSHAPLFSWAAAALKLREANLGRQFQQAITTANAHRILASGTG